MNIKTTKTGFANAVSRVSRAISASSSLPSMGCVLIEGIKGGIRLTGTNGDIIIGTVLNCEVTEPVKMAVPAGILNKLLSALPEGVLDIGYDPLLLKVEVKSDVGRTKISCIDPNLFPSFKNEKDVATVTIQGNALREMLRKTGYAISNDDTRKALRNMLLSLRSDGLTAVATDGRILAKVEYSGAECDLDDGIDILIPQSACPILADKSIIGAEGVVKIDVPKESRTYAKFTCGDTALRTILFDGVFPDYHRVIPEETENPAKVDRSRLLEALERAAIFSPAGESGYVSLTFSPNGSLRVESQKSDAGHYDETMPLTYNGDEVRVLVAKRYVAPILKATDDDEVQFHIRNSSAPVLVTCSVPFVAVVMPMRDEAAQ